MKHWKLRKPQKDDLGFIYQTWLNSYYVDSELRKAVRRSVFSREYRKIIDHLLHQSSILIACKPDDEFVIYGYLVYERHLLHYCFVKEAFRFSGIAKDMVEKAMGKHVVYPYSHHTHSLKPIVEKYSFLTYNPFILFEGYQSHE